MHGFPSDCDQRDERLGWLGDAQLSSEEATFNYDMTALYQNYVQDIADSEVNGTVSKTSIYELMIRCFSSRILLLKCSIVVAGNQVILLGQLRYM